MKVQHPRLNRWCMFASEQALYLKHIQANKLNKNSKRWIKLDKKLQHSHLTQIIKYLPFFIWVNKKNNNLNFLISLGNLMIYLALLPKYGFDSHFNRLGAFHPDVTIQTVNNWLCPRSSFISFIESLKSTAKVVEIFQ